MAAGFRRPGLEVNLGVDIKAPIAKNTRLPAGIAQLVEHDLAKVGVASSSLVSRSRFDKTPLAGVLFLSGIDPRVGCANLGS